MVGRPDPASLERPWLAAYPPGVPPTYRLPSVALPRLLDDAVRDFPDHPAVVSDGVTVDHAQLAARVDDVARALAQLGVDRGDRVLVALRNEPTLPVVLLAVWRMAAVAVPVAIEPAEQGLLRVVADARPTAAIGTDDTLHALAEADALPRIAVAVTGGEWPPARRLPWLPRPGRPRRARRVRDGAVALADLLADGADAVPPALAAPDDPALLAYRDDGIEAVGAVLTHANLVATAFQARLWVPDVQAGRERVLVVDPGPEIAPLSLGLLVALLAAGCVVLAHDPEPASLARLVERERPTLFPTTPHRLEALLSDGDAARRDLTSLRVCLVGGAPLDPALAAAVEQRTEGARVRAAYGRREAGGLTHAQPVYGRVVPDTIGLPVTDTVAVVVDPDDHACVCPPGEVGRLLVHGPQVSPGYWAREEHSGTSFPDHWLDTGDLAVVDEDGLFRYVGRDDEVTYRDGAVVAPRWIAAILERHPAVRDAGVVATDAEVLVGAVLRRRTRVTVDELLAHCRAHLEPAMVPDRIKVVDALPEPTADPAAWDRLRQELRREDPA